ncbi:hypothetical protein PVAP13_8KG161604 [Panicum virgatum]|uniref:Endonuclease/exonuclease/phosphatase domain-containing protein n=1 Tax=Panicum virgatum TaxID=38727 RepID=A0A8T0PHS8_PANVG|nr:hypothetical protein PVAP13_8KG161604 [Panicum virgatum]
MNLLSVNCRGCGKPEVVQELLHIVEEKQPAVVFLLETRMNEEHARGVQRALGFPNAIVVKSEGRSGGLILMWRGDVENLRVVQWQFTGFYGEPRRERRKESWYLMRFLRAHSSVPWLCVGDFNELLAAEEQIGANEREQWQMAAFSDAVNDCRLMDLGYHGLPYTWDNRQDADRNVKARLDRALGDDKFLESFGDTEVFHIPLAESDHCGILVEVRQKTLVRPGRGRRKAKPFRYENMWQRHGEYVDFVNRIWDPGLDQPDLTVVANALLSLQTSLKTWDREVFGSVKNRLEN